MRSSSLPHQSSWRRLSSVSRNFVGQIVGRAAIGVDVVEILMQMFRQQEADHVEILVVRGRELRVYCFGCFSRRITALTVME